MHFLIIFWANEFIIVEKKQRAKKSEQFFGVEVPKLAFQPSVVRTSSHNVDGRVLRTASSVYSRTRCCQIMRVTGSAYVNHSGRIGNAARQIFITSSVA